MCEYTFAIGRALKRENKSKYTLKMNYMIALDVSSSAYDSRIVQITVVCLSVVARCNFESYGLCGLEQQQNDELDWKLIQSDQRADNVPSSDHTLGTSQGQ